MPAHNSPQTNHEIGFLHRPLSKRVGLTDLSRGLLLLQRVLCQLVPRQSCSSYLLVTGSVASAAKFPPWLRRAYFLLDRHHQDSATL